MGYLKVFFAIFQFVAVINISTQGTFQLHVRLDAECNASAVNYTPVARAKESLWHFYSELTSDFRLQDCSCERRNLTCCIKYDGQDEDMRRFTTCLNTTTTERSGTFIASFAVETIVNTERCNGKSDFSRSGSFNPPNTSCAKQINVNASGQSSTSASTSNSNVGNKTTIIGGAIGGTLAALAALLPLSYYMYRRLKRRSEVCDTNNSTANMFGATPVVGFEEAPNSVAPAGTG